MLCFDVTKKPNAVVLFQVKQHTCMLTMHVFLVGYFFGGCLFACMVVPFFVAPRLHSCILLVCMHGDCFLRCPTPTPLFVCSTYVQLATMPVGCPAWKKGRIRRLGEPLRSYADSGLKDVWVLRGGKVLHKHLYP